MMEEDIVVVAEDIELSAHLAGEPDTTVMLAEPDVFSHEEIQDIFVGPEVNL